MKVRTLSLWQPWATAIAVGAKQIETRGRKTHVRGVLAIHAAQKRNNDLRGTFARLLEDHDDINVFFQAAGERSYDSMPFGKIIALAELVDSVPVEMIKPFFEMEEALGDYSTGRYGWILRNVKRLPEPIPWRGAQGFFFSEIPDDIYRQYLKTTTTTRLDFNLA